MKASNKIVCSEWGFPDRETLERIERMLKHIVLKNQIDFLFVRKVGPQQGQKLNDFLLVDIIGC